MLYSIKSLFFTWFIGKISLVHIVLWSIYFLFDIFIRYLKKCAIPYIKKYIIFFYISMRYIKLYNIKKSLFFIYINGSNILLIVKVWGILCFNTFIFLYCLPKNALQYKVLWTIYSFSAVSMYYVFHIFTRRENVLTG